MNCLYFFVICLPCVDILVLTIVIDLLDMPSYIGTFDYPTNEDLGMQTKKAGQRKGNEPRRQNGFAPQ